MTLNDIEFNVVITKAMGLSEKEALAYLERKETKIDRRKYYRILGTLEVKALERLYEIAKNFKQLHLDRLDKFRTIEKNMWEQYEREQDATKKVIILNSIADIQFPISQLIEVTKEILEENAVKQTKEILSTA